jgi:hypothetical protein
VAVAVAVALAVVAVALAAVAAVEAVVVAVVAAEAADFTGAATGSRGWRRTFATSRGPAVACGATSDLGTTTKLQSRPRERSALSLRSTNRRSMAGAAARSNAWP